MTQAWDEGWRAFEAGAMSYENPYPVYMEEHEDWLSGWSSACLYDPQDEW